MSFEQKYKDGVKVKLVNHEGVGEIFQFDAGDGSYLVIFEFHSSWAAEGDILEVVSQPKGRRR